MAKQRIRDVKQGKVKTENLQKKKSKEENIGFRYATSTIKIKAWLTDAFMLVMPIMFAVFYLVMDGREDFEKNMFMGWVYILVPLIFIQTIFMYVSGQTPGYKAYNLYLLDQNTDERPKLFIIIFRNLSAVLSLFTFAWMLMFFRRDSKTLHDLLSATAVVHKP